VDKNENFWIIGDAESKKNETIKQIKKNGARFINSEDVIVTGDGVGQDDQLRVNYDVVDEKDYPRYALLAGGAEQNYIETFFKKKDGKTHVTRDAEYVLRLQGAKKYNPNAKDEPAVEL
jgi:hypothetical protein